MNKTEEQLKEELSPDLYKVARQGGTEAPYAGKYYKNKEKGMYKCAVCGEELFSSDTKFDSYTGWPSFDDVVSSDKIETHKDVSHGMARTEVRCKKCKSHLGHVFDDGPKETTGKRYCINSICLDFEKAEELK
ncbi:MAG: peptide-methionine (R)-S-oxide reductase [Candidatus Yanofskybacteria bacterium CG10_big_fil_rev_8_21_14_0_10_46_23]|uniref:peptide-methionine (R)-S-oxide reductase n=1 Tax=Candidatus Yanofskybacteria bacterium CG10_big_fil_rev_8_21_14_0_10_46_23 TaxID=1975098 RepID=A0A2H0R4Y4_9BACT|nr:MAG: peptide-methionine (R)-S-oxide reductase [Candidatus Yanofskybacteria bacterium CG10_big_fil_rev_8_21_14_0_10_46_23]